MLTLTLSCPVAGRLLNGNTYSAYKISIQVNKAQNIPQMSLMHQNLPPQHLLWYLLTV